MSFNNNKEINYYFKLYVEPNVHERTNPNLDKVFQKWTTKLYEDGLMSNEVYDNLYRERL